MRLLITCEFGDSSQVLIMDPATEADAGKITEAQAGDPAAVLTIRCQSTPDGPVRSRLIRAGEIRSLTRE